MALSDFGSSCYQRSALAVSLGVCLAIASASNVHADEPPRLNTPVFDLLKTDGQTVSGQLRPFGPDGAIKLLQSGDQEVAVPIANVVKLTRGNQVSPLNPEASVVLFPDDDRLYRTAIETASETHLAVQSYSLGKLSIPLESILGLVLSLPTDSTMIDDLTDRARNTPRTSEIAWLANGDQILGGFLGLTEKHLEFSVEKKPLKIDRSGVVAIGFDPSLVAYPKPEEDFLEYTFVDGSRLGLTDPKIAETELTGRTRFGVTVHVPLLEIAKIHSRSSKIVYLTEKTVAAEKYVGYIGKPRSFRKNVNVEGHYFRLSGQDYDRGLGTESRTLLAYRLEPNDQRFQATVGLDDRAGPLGNVVFKVIVDNQERYKSPPMSVRDTPQFVDVDLNGAKILVLITEFGERGNVRDLADWVEARILR